MLWVGVILGNIIQKNNRICPPDLIGLFSLVILGSKKILQGYSEISLSTKKCLHFRKENLWRLLYLPSNSKFGINNPQLGSLVLTPSLHPGMGITLCVSQAALMHLWGVFSPCQDTGGELPAAWIFLTNLSHWEMLKMLIRHKYSQNYHYYYYYINIISINCACCWWVCSLSHPKEKD